MIFTVKNVYVEELEVGNELDLDGDEYGDNEFAIFNYAKVLDLDDVYIDGDPWVYVRTSQGSFQMPSGHKVKVKTVD